MDRTGRNIEELLLNWHLDALTPDERAWLSAELERDAELQAKCDRLGRLLQPLDHWSPPPESSGLSDRILAHVRSAPGPTSFAASNVRKSDPLRIRFGRLSTLRLREVLAVAACIVVLIGVSVPGVSALRDRSRRALCASHLCNIFVGVSSYQQSFGGALPFAGNVPNAAWLPAGAVDGPYASNSRHLYRLLKLGYLANPEVFICPSDAYGQPMAARGAADWDDFALARNLSYASLNLSGPSPRLKPALPVAYLSDPNPLFSNAVFVPVTDPDQANSPAHRGRGQMVLMLDGNARWMTRPIYGPQRDNLWLLGGLQDYTGREAPTTDEDVQLVPGLPATDPAVLLQLRQATGRGL